ncbi:MAG: hypothetical protein JST96_09060 [Bacteroidetes bacterium]|nr:hypothetical protein [Bacteroidota bacterium]
METKYAQQEILLITGTSFSSRQLCETNDNRGPKSDIEKLEDACWNGLLPEILPEIFRQPCNEKKLYLWDIKEAQHFIELELSEYPELVEKYFSIDPYTFLQVQYSN